MIALQLRWIYSTLEVLLESFIENYYSNKKRILNHQEK